jgi:hypothetical protein
MKTDNELIAEFMGRPLTCMHDMGHEVVERRINYDDYWQEWNNLMPTLEKISGIDSKTWLRSPNIEITPNYCSIVVMGTELTVFQIYIRKPHWIDAAYSAVVQFIKWYNEQPKTL